MRGVKMIVSMWGGALIVTGITKKVWSQVKEEK